MKKCRLILRIAIISLLIMNTGNFLAQTAPDNYVKIKGKVLDNKKSDITVFLHNGTNWKKTHTKKNKSKYCIKLNPEEDYYIMFESNDGLVKSLIVEGGETGIYIMELDINFKQTSIKYARLFQVENENKYKILLIHKDNENIVYENIDLPSILVQVKK